MTAVGNLPAGSRLTAALLQAVAPFAALKGADEPVTSSTVLQNDDALLLTLPANTSWFFVASIDYEGGTQGASDLKWHWSVPTGTTMRYCRLGIDTSGASTAGFMSTEGTTAGAGTAGAGSLKGMLQAGTVSVSSTSGPLQFQWAQNTSNATATIVHAGSVLAMWQLI